MLRSQIQQLINMGPLPDSSSATSEQLVCYQNLLESIPLPVNDDEAIVLASLFGSDDCYGMAWTLIHIIETSPHWPLAECLNDVRNEWILNLRTRAENGGKF